MQTEKAVISQLLNKQIGFYQFFLARFSKIIRVVLQILQETCFKCKINFFALCR